MNLSTIPFLSLGSALYPLHRNRRYTRRGPRAPPQAAMAGWRTLPTWARRQSIRKSGGVQQMGRRPAADIACPRGIAIRSFKHEQRIQIAFSYRGVECRELLSLRPITQSAITYATGLRAEILRKIADSLFHYPDYFPSSARAKQFEAGGRRILIGKLLQKQLDV